MPTDETGTKWACESCVRGHRASKCEHFNRWMVRVKKPGRPLRECPHNISECECLNDKAIMMKVPKFKIKNGECDCLRVRTLDPAVDNPDSRSPGPILRIQVPQDPTPTVPCNNLGPNQQVSEESGVQMQEYQQHSPADGASNGTVDGQYIPDTSSNGDAIIPQQPGSDIGSSQHGIPAAISTPPTQGSQAPHQEQRDPIVQIQSPTTVQGVELPQEVDSNTSVYSNLGHSPGQQLGTQLLHRLAPSTHNQYITNGTQSIESHDMPPFVQSRDPSTRDVEDPRYPKTLALKQHFEQQGYQYPEPHDPFPLSSPAGPSTDLNGLSNSSNCQCGPGCNCAYCLSHPYNAATRERVQRLNQIMAIDFQWSANQIALPQSGYGGIPVDGTSVEPVVEQGSNLSPAFGWDDASIQGPALQPTSDERTVVDDSSLTDGFSPNTMRSSGYIDLPYPVEFVNMPCTNVSGTCLCGSDCTCLGCLTHHGHVELPQ